MFFILLQNFIVSSLSTTVNCWRQKLFCFLSSLSTCAELSGSCSSSRGRVGLPRNPPNYTSVGSGAKSKWSYTVLRSGFVLCAFFRWRLLNLLWVKPWGIQCNFCLSWPALTHAQLAEAGRAWVEQGLVLAGGVCRCTGWGVFAAHCHSSVRAKYLVVSTFQNSGSPECRKLWNPGSAASELAEVACINQAQHVRRAHSVDGGIFR